MGKSLYIVYTYAPGMNMNEKLPFREGGASSEQGEEKQSRKMNIGRCSDGAELGGIKR